jgi:lysyl-tRNA synthetase class 1
MAHLDTEHEVAVMKGSPLTDADLAEVTLRSDYAKRWLTTSAPEEFRFVLQTTLPEVARTISDEQKKALATAAPTLDAVTPWNGETIHAALHGLKEASGLSPKDFFTPFYRALLGKDSGPKLGWFLSTLDRKFVVDRLRDLVA